MKTLLILNSSSKKEGSISRSLTSIFVDEWMRLYPDDIIMYRDIHQSQIPHISAQWIEAAFKPIEQRSAADISQLELSNKLVDELIAADIVVLGTPMYNWSIPSCLKAYLDHIVRINLTILLNEGDAETPVKGLLQNKQAFLCLSRGGLGYDNGEKFASTNFQSSYLKHIFHLIGFHTVSEIAINGTSHSEIAISTKQNEATKKIKEIISKPDF